MTRREDFDQSFHMSSLGGSREQSVTVSYTDPFRNTGAAARMVRTKDAHRPWAHDVDNAAFREDEQGALFYSEPGGLKVDNLFAHQGAAHAVPTLLGILGHESLKRYGRLPDADRSLSVHSAKIVQNLVDRGVVKNPHERSGTGRVRVTNNVTRGAESNEDALSHAYNVSRMGRKVDPADVNRGQQFTRALLRRPRVRTSSENPGLFPSEGYFKPKP